MNPLHCQRALRSNCKQVCLSLASRRTLSSIIVCATSIRGNVDFDPRSGLRIDLHGSIVDPSTNMARLFLFCFLPFAISSPAPARAVQCAGQHHVQYLPSQTPDIKRDSSPNLNTNHRIRYDWSYNPNAQAPHPPGPLSPWIDVGRSQMLDNFDPTPWTNCPFQSLDCERCPHNGRRAISRSYLATPIQHAQPTPQPAGVGEYNAITGQQDSDIPAAAGQAPPPCPLQKCSVAGAKPCGPGAMCKKDYCACPPGRKGQPIGTAGSMGLRGWTWPEALNVYVNPGVPCAMPCDTLFCGEVRRARGCAGLQSLDPGDMNETNPSVVAAEASVTTPVSVSQEIVLGTADTVSVAKLSSHESSSTVIAALTRSFASQASLMLPQSTGRKGVQTRSAVRDDTAMPIAPGGSGAIQAPRMPGDGAGNG